MTEPTLTRAQARAIEHRTFDWHDLVVTPVVLPIAEPPVYHRIPTHSLAVDFGRAASQGSTPPDPANAPPPSLSSSAGGTRVPTGRAREETNRFVNGCLLGMGMAVLLWAAILKAGYDVWRWLT